MGPPRKPSKAGCVGRGNARERNEGWPLGCPEWSGLCVDDAMPVEGVEKLADFIRAFDKAN